MLYSCTRMATVGINGLNLVCWTKSKHKKL